MLSRQVKLEALEWLMKELKPNREQNEPSWENLVYASVMRLRCKRAVDLAKNKVVLDLCCGTGWCSFELSKVAKTVVGIDRNPVCIEYAKLKYQRPNIIFLVRDALNFHLKGPYDLVVMCETLEHFFAEEGPRLMEQIKKILKTEGIVYGTTPIAPPDKVTLFESWNIWHRHIYTRRELQKFLQNWFSDVVIKKIAPQGTPDFYEYFICQELKP